MLPLLLHTSNVLIEMLTQQKILTSTLITIWENTDSCEEQYICPSALYLMSVMLQYYSIITDRGISTPGHGKELVDGINAIGNSYIYIN